MDKQTSKASKEIDSDTWTQAVSDSPWWVRLYLGKVYSRNSALVALWFTIVGCAVSLGFTFVNPKAWGVLLMFLHGGFMVLFSIYCVDQKIQS